MTIPSKFVTRKPRHLLHVVTVAFALSLSGCEEVTTDRNSDGSGGSSTVESSSVGGATSIDSKATGGATSTVETTQAGAGGTTEVLESICEDESGATVPYDYSFGLMGEYAFELSTNCDIGGYMTPLVQADPEMLTKVDAFVAEATDWYRAEVLNCADATTLLGDDAYGLLPVSQSNDLSEADFDASMAIFLMVIDRHDALPDAVSSTKKAKIKDRIKSVKTRAVHNTAVGLTKTLSEPDCIPVTSS